MCGIAGFWVQPHDTREVLRRQICAMNKALLHRGPDDGGTWVDEQVGVALANRRLAILDLTVSGHQPMSSRCGRFVIAYNGEVYNFESIRDDLREDGKTFRSHTDTEAIVEGCASWGLKGTLERLNGMFAFALWDRKDRTLNLVRDRLGIKPLYYGRFGGTLLFGSELKSLVAHPAFTREIDRKSLALFFRHGYIPAPYTIYKNVRKLPAGHALTLSSADLSLESVPYWSAKSLGGDTCIGQLAEDEAITQLEMLLRDAVRLQMVSDVPLGAFLSGGIDSSMVVALMQAQSVRRVRTFSIGFAQKSYNEADYASAVAQHLGTDHSSLYVSPKQIAESVDALPDIYDEPFADPSQIPTYLLSRLTREHVTVSLSGDGGDELFGGYDHYRQLHRRWKMLRRVPRPVRAFGAKAVNSLSAIPEVLHIGGTRNFRSRLRNVAGILGARSPELLSHHCLSHWKTPSEVAAYSQEPATAFTDEEQWPKTHDSLRRIMYLDLVTYLPDDVLTKVDRASMAVSLEARVPLLDHRVVELAMRTRHHLKMRNHEGKWLLRQVLYRYLPKELFDRPKMGFSVPIDAWLRGPLRPWADDLLSETLKTPDDLLDSALIKRKWTEHINADCNWGHQLWDVLMFQAWQRRWL
jgi:asparagine synthase (glutamine-hydrolysing)